MLGHDLGCDTYVLVKNLLPRDPFYSAVLQYKEDPCRSLLSLEILESAAFVASLSRGEIIAYNKPEYLHLLSVVEAVWCGRKEVEIEKMIRESKEDKLKLTNAALSVFAYKWRWTNIIQAQTFVGRPLTQEELERLAYAAGAAENKELLVSLRNLDERLLNNAYTGARRYGKESAVDTVQKLGLDLAGYKKVVTVTGDDIAVLADSSLRLRLIFAFIALLYAFILSLN